MPLTPVQIKDKLTNALDDDKNQVVDEKAVEEVIALLEASTITKEILEQTRLGRDINHVRKICRNPTIARRAKNLVKTWKKLIVVPGSPQVANGQHPMQRISPGLPAVSSKSLPSPSPLQTRQQQQQGFKVMGSSSPVIQAKGGQPFPPSKLDVKTRTGEIIRSPKPGAAAGGGGSQMQLLRNSSINIQEDSNLSWPGTPPSNVSENSQDRLSGDNQESFAADKNCQNWAGRRNFSFENKPSDSSNAAASKSANRASDQRDVSKTNVANRKRTRTGQAEYSMDSLPHSASKQFHRVSSSSSLSAFGKNDTINGSVIRKPVVKSPGFSLSNSGFTSLVSPPAANSSLLKSSLSDQFDSSSLPNRINQRAAALRQDSADSRLSASSEGRGFKEKLTKVKTTEQLIEDMQKKSATAVGTNIMTQIRTNKIEKESDPQPAPLPRTGRGKKRKNKKDLDLPDLEPISEGGKLAKTKSEYIERFLQTSVAPTPGEDAFEQHMSHLCPESLEEQPIPLAGCSSTFVQPAYETSFQPYSTRQDKPDSGPSASPPETRDMIEGPSHLPSTASAALDDSSAQALDHLSHKQILARLPPVDFDNIDWTSHDYHPPQPVQVTDALVERLHHGNLEGINGTHDRDGQFKKWNEMLTLDSVYDEPIHILPYVILD